jgi:hypothetical protein
LEEKSKWVRHTVQKDPKELFSFPHNSESTKESAVQKIDQFISSGVHYSSHLLRHILTMRKLITDNNVNPSMALDSILIFLSKTSTMKETNEK